MSNFKIFIVEDDPWYGEILKYHLSLNPDYEVTLFQNGKGCIDNLYKNPDVICIDFGLPDMTGDVLLNKIRTFNKVVPVFVISGQDQISVVLSLLKHGAYEYIIKDDNAKDLLWNAILRVKENSKLKKEVEELKDELEKKYNFENFIIGQSKSIRRIFSTIEKATSSNINISISGETGTGKEVVAKAIHFNSDRRKKAFVTVNMAAIPRELVESELFGHEKGAFTGATARRIGKFEEASGGTIFLDEIAELETSMQAKLLRVLQEREITRVGGNDTVKLDVRLITATFKDLTEQVKNNLFREDLYYRIMGLPIELPPLRERADDILILAKHFISEFCVANKTKIKTLDESAREKLMKYNYPGNVRELKAIVDLSCVISEGTQIRSEDISFTNLKSGQEFTAVEKTMQDYTWDIIQFYLKKYNNNVMLVASKLDIGKSTIYNFINRNETKQDA